MSLRTLFSLLYCKPAVSVLGIVLIVSGCGDSDSPSDAGVGVDAEVGANVDADVDADADADVGEEVNESAQVPANVPLTSDTNTLDESQTDSSEQEPEGEVQPDIELVNPNSVFVPDASDLPDRNALYQEDGYDVADVIRIDVRTDTSPGICTEDDQSGCTLADVIADIDAKDDFKVEIAVHFSTADYPDDGSSSNAELRQRGGGSRAAPQKSFRIKLDDKDNLWRTERHLQLNKHPFDSSRIRNKLAFDLMSEVPHLLSFRTQFANVWIDDGQGPQDYGLFTHVERGDERYQERRGLLEDGNLYKAELFLFQELELESLRLDDNGEPLLESAFEEVLEIQSGEDHSNLVAMLTAMHDPTRSFQSVLDQYFNENNVLTWLTFNLLIGQYDSIRHNYFLFNPLGTEKFYFLPWDYDSSFNEHIEPANEFSNDALRQRLDYGYAIGSSNAFIDNYYRLPGAHDRILRAATEIRQNVLTNENVAEKANRYAEVIDEFALSEPDSENNPFFLLQPGVPLGNLVASNHEALIDRFSYPMPHTLNEPLLENDQWLFSWRPAHDLTGNTISYDLQIASSPAFLPDSVAVSLTGIANQSVQVSQLVDADLLNAGTYYVRVVARTSSEPQRFWQIADNTLDENGTIYLGQVRFTAP